MGSPLKFCFGTVDFPKTDNPTDVNLSSLPNNFQGVEAENQCKVDEADSIQKNKQNEVGTDNSNGERLQNDAQDVGSGGSASGVGGVANHQEQQQQNNNNHNSHEHITNGPLSTRSAENNNNNNSVLLPGIPPEIAAAINGGHDLFVCFFNFFFL